MKWKKRIVLAVVLACMPLNVVWAAEAKWYDENRLVGHALGSVDAKIETNSKEAFLESWSQGFRVVEADFSITSDGELVVRHDFDQDSYYRLEQTVNGNIVMNLNKYKNQKINFKYTPLTAEDLFRLLVEYPDMYLITDTKNIDNQTVKKQFNAFLKYARQMQAPEILDRMVVQIYNQQMYNVIKEIYPFENWIYTLYQEPNRDYNAIADFCNKNNIDVVTLNYELIEDGGVQILNQHGIKVYAHTVNRMVDFKKALNAGCYGIYTDVIMPKDLYHADIKRPWGITKKMIRSKHANAYASFCQIGDEDYIRLRDLAAILNKTPASFSASYNNTTNTIELTRAEQFDTIGNEMILIPGNDWYTKKTSVQLSIDGQPIDIQGYTVDYDYFYPVDAISQVLDITILPGDIPGEFQLAINE